MAYPQCWIAYVRVGRPYCEILPPRQPSCILGQHPFPSRLWLALCLVSCAVATRLRGAEASRNRSNPLLRLIPSDWMGPALSPFRGHGARYVRPSLLPRVIFRHLDNGLRARLGDAAAESQG